MRFGVCPNCERNIDIGEDPEIGDHLLCRTCWTEVFIVWKNPIELMRVDYEEHEEYEGYEEYDLVGDDIQVSDSIKNELEKKITMPPGKPKKNVKKATNNSGKNKKK